MRNFINAIAPTWVKKIYRANKEKELVHEINKLPIASMGVDNKHPWVRLDNGLVFYGFPPGRDELFLYQSIKNLIPHVEEKYFSVVCEIISRYLIPRSIPGEMFFNPSKLHPLRDPLNDFKLSLDKKNQLAQFFRPKPGNIYLDIGAFQGYGTMRLAELVTDSGHVFAFESDPAVLEVLELNISKNNIKNVTIIPKAVGAEPGEKTFYRSEGTVNSLNKWVLNNKGYTNLDSLTVEVTTIDSELAERSIESIDMVNITINGGEYDALKGMTAILSKSKNVRVTLAGWYFITEKEKVSDIVTPYLKNLGFEVMVGELGRVLAWKI